MKKQLLIAILLISTVFTACAHGKKTVRKKASRKAPVTASVRGLSSIMMRRGACFGRCPEYTLTINANGLIVYNGTRNTEPLGVYEKNVGAEKAQAILKSFMDNRVDTCSALYTSRIADLPGLSYTLSYNGRQQLIGNADFGPRFLVELSLEMDELGTVDKSWKKVSSTPNGE